VDFQVRSYRNGMAEPAPEFNGTPEASSSIQEKAAQQAVKILLDNLWDGAQEIKDLSPSILCELDRLLYYQELNQDVTLEESHPSSSAKRKLPCVKNKHGHSSQSYKVKEMHNELVITCRAVSAETATHFQKEIIRLRHEAEERITNAPADSTPVPLLQEEVARAMLRTPQMQLSFFSTIRFGTVGKRKISSPPVQNLKVALRHMAELMAARDRCHGKEEREQQAIIKITMSEMQQDGANSRQLFARHVQSLRETLTELDFVIPSFVEKCQAKVLELEPAFNQERRKSVVALARVRELELDLDSERCKANVALSLQKAFSWSTEAAACATEHIRNLPPQELQRRLEHLLAAPKNELHEHAVVDLTRDRSRSRSRENCQVMLPDGSRSAPSRQSLSNGSASSSWQSDDRRWSRQSHSTVSQVPLRRWAFPLIQRSACCNGSPSAT